MPNTDASIRTSRTHTPVDSIHLTCFLIENGLVVGMLVNVKCLLLRILTDDAHIHFKPHNSVYVSKLGQYIFCQSFFFHAYIMYVWGVRLVSLSSRHPICVLRTTHSCFDERRSKFRSIFAGCKWNFHANFSHFRGNWIRASALTGFCFRRNTNQNIAFYTKLLSFCEPVRCVLHVWFASDPAMCSMFIKKASKVNFASNFLCDFTISDIMCFRIATNSVIASLIKSMEKLCRIISIIKLVW